MAFSWELLSEHYYLTALRRRVAAAASAAAVSAADTACEAAELADYHASTAHYSCWANDYMTDRAIMELGSDYL